jgi:hypothetical protein
MKDLHKIEKSKKEVVDEEQLLEFVMHNLSIEAHDKVENNIAEDPFLMDAVEGLNNISNKDQINQSITELNQHLNKLVQNKAKHKHKRRLPVNQWAMLAVVVVLFLLVVTYFIIHLQGGK